MSKNYGLILEPQVPEDFVFGAYNALDTKFAGRVPLVESGDWSKYLPENEKQAPDFETYACVSFGTNNVVEILKKRLGITENNSDRFVAKETGTNFFKGNTPKTIGDHLRKKWTCYETEWSTADATSFEDFYKEIPQNLKTLAIGRGAEYEFGYEVVQAKDIKEALKFSPLGASFPAWHLGSDGVYYRPEGVADNHWAVIFAMQPNGNFLVLDTYPPFIKEVKTTPSIVYGYYLNKKVVNDNAFVRFLKDLWQALMSGEPQSVDVPKPVEPKPEPVTMVSGVNTRGHSHAWRGGTIEERKAMFQLANELGKAQELHKFKSKILPDTHTLLDDYLATIEGESGFNAWCVNTQSLDFGVAQFSIKYYCKEYNMTPQDCIDNPRKCLEIMAVNFKSKRRENWIAFQGAKERLQKGTLKIYA